MHDYQGIRQNRPKGGSELFVKDARIIRSRAAIRRRARGLAPKQRLLPQTERYDRLNTVGNRGQAPLPPPPLADQLWCHQPLKRNMLQLRGYLRVLEDVAFERWQLERDHPEIANLSNAQLVAKMIDENNLYPEEGNTKPPLEGPHRKLTAPELADHFIEIQDRDVLTICFEQLFAEEQACFRFDRDLVLLPLLDETTGDWHLTMGIDGEDKSLDQPITPAFRNLDLEEDPSDDTGETSMEPDEADYERFLRLQSIGSPIFRDPFLGHQELKGFSPWGTVAWLVDDATNEVHLAFLLDFNELLEKPTPPCRHLLQENRMQAKSEIRIPDFNPCFSEI